MAQKKQGKQAPKSIQHIDHYARISYLYQASNHFAANPKYAILSRALARNVNLVSKKAVSKVTPGMKRTICKTCHSVLVPGINVVMEIENRSKAKAPQSDILVHTCNTCGEKKRFPIGKDRTYEVFSERDDVKIDID